MVSVQVKSLGSKMPDFAPFKFEPSWEDSESEPFRVRHLIAKVVSEAVRDFHLRQKEDALMALTASRIAKGLEVGRIGRSYDERQQVKEEEAIGQAQQAFEDGLFLLFVDEQQKKDLDEVVTLVPETNITFIRLVALSGR